jgi:hypothetical protein
MAESVGSRSPKDIVPHWADVGRIVATRLELLHYLGSGTVGHAFLANDRLTGERVVAKISKLARSDGGPILEEYRVLHAINSHALPTPVGYFVHEQEDEVFPILVVDYAEGLPLERWAVDKSPRERMKALAALSGELAVLTTTPGARHGDLWERNVIVSPAGAVRLIDPDGGSLGPSSLDPGTVLLDTSGYCSLLRKFVTGPDVRAINQLLKRIEESAGAVQFGDVATHLLTVLKNPLPSEVAGEIGALAAVVASDRERRQTLYRRIRDTRETEFLALTARAEAIFGALGSSTPDAGHAALYQHELSTDGLPKGMFQNRGKQFTSLDGDTFNLGIDGITEFVKPWPFPTKEGLLSTGYANVVVDGATIASEKLELWHIDSPQFMSLEINRYLAFDNRRLERLAKILVRVILPGLSSPHVSEARPKSSGLTTFYTHEHAIKNLGLEHSLPMLPKNWLHVTLATPRHVLSSNIPVGSDLGRVFGVPRALRLKVIQDVARSITESSYELFDTIYSIDITNIDDANRSLSVSVDARQSGSKKSESWQFDLSFPGNLSL